LAQDHDECYNILFTGNKYCHYVDVKEIMSSAGVDSEGLDALVIVSTYNSIERRSNGGF